MSTQEHERVRSLLLRLSLGLVLAMVAASCGESTLGNASVSSIPANAGVEVLNGAFAACDGPADGPDALSFIRSVDHWVEAVSVPKWDPGDPEGTSAVNVVRPNGATVEVFVHSSARPGMDWTLAAGGDLWLAIGDVETYGRDLAIYILAFNPDGQAFFAGKCQAERLYEPLRLTLGEDFDQRMRDAAGEVGGALDGALGVEESEPQPSGDAVVDPDYVDESLLDSLQSVTLHITISEALGTDATICTRTDARWNDCVHAVQRLVDVGVVLSAYVDNAGLLEFWLLDGAADINSPMRLLGTVEVPTSLRAVQDAAIRVEIDTSDPSGSTDGVVLVDSARLSEIAETDASWPALWAPYP